VKQRDLIKRASLLQAFVILVQIEHKNLDYAWST